MHQTGYYALYEIYMPDILKHNFMLILEECILAFKGSPFLKPISYFGPEPGPCNANPDPFHIFQYY